MQRNKVSIFGNFNYVFLLLFLFISSNQSLANSDVINLSEEEVAEKIKSFSPSDLENFSSLFSPKIDKTKAIMFFLFEVDNGQKLEETFNRMSEVKFTDAMDINEDILLDFLANENEGKKIGLSAREYKETVVEKNFDTGKYIGQVNEEGLPKGKGELIYDDGEKLIGEWNIRPVNGTLTYPNGKKYVGVFDDNGQVTGKGTLTWPNGEKFVGEVIYAQPSSGTFTWPNGRKYVGEFQKGKRNGSGTFTWPSGTKYVGEFKDDWRTGKGTQTWSDGGKYVGGFKKNKRHGYGKHTYADGSVEEGIWDNGASPKLVNSRNKKEFKPVAVCIGANKESQIKTLINLFSINNTPAAVSYMLDAGCNNSWSVPISGKNLEEFTRNLNYVGVKTREYMSGIGWVYAMIKVDEWDSY